MHRWLPWIRPLEALVLSAFAGAFVWLLGLDRWLPLLSHAALGFLTGGTALLRTGSYAIASRERRVALALLATLAGCATLHALRYTVFAAAASRQVQATDWRIDDATAARAVADSLREETGFAGPVGFLLGELRVGASYAYFRLAGLPLAVLRLAELGLALVVATRWAGGPKSVTGT